MQDRRSFLKMSAAGAAAAQAAAATGQAVAPPRPYKRIATEEAFTTATLIKAQQDYLAKTPPNDPGIVAMIKGLVNNPRFAPLLLDIEGQRLRDMDRLGIDMQLLSVTAPGPQVLQPAEGTAIARAVNDEIVEACRRHPTRFRAMATVAPQEPKNAAIELERCINKLGFRGMMINSHIHGEYLDLPKYWELLEAAEALDVPIYIHPTDPPANMIGQYQDRGLEGALAGFSHEVWLHLMAIITSGAFDRFPKLKFVIGHMGEGMPLLLYRFDYMQTLAARPGLRGKPEGTKLKRKISEYMKTNVWITTSGMAWEPAIKFTQDVVGVDHVLYAMDYPYQRDQFEVDATDALNIPDAAKKMLYQTNAEKLYRLV
jgi:5-carboxyvanillate decarboxylase